MWHVETLLPLRRASRVWWVGVAVLLWSTTGHAVDPREVAPLPQGDEMRLDPELETLFQEKLAVLDSILQIINTAPESVVTRELMQRSAELEREIEALRGSWREESLRRSTPPLPPEVPRPPAPAIRKRKPRSYNLIKFGEVVVINVDEVVRGDAVIVAGDLWVEGEILGDALVFGGDLQLGREARVRGQAIAMGGRVETSPGAEVDGQAIGLALIPRPFFTDLGDEWPQWVSLLLDVLKLGFLMLVAGILLVLVPDRIARASAYLKTSFLRCFGFGLLMLTGGSFAVFASVILLVITFIGIPMALLVAFLSGLLVIASLFVGVVLIGDRVRQALGWRAHTPLISVFLGLFLILLPELLADLLHIALPLPQARVGFGLLSTVLVLMAITSGLGALVLSRLGGMGGQVAGDLGGEMAARVSPRSAPGGSG